MSNKHIYVYAIGFIVVLALLGGAYYALMGTKVINMGTVHGTAVHGAPGGQNTRNQPITKGTVIVVPADQADKLWRAAGYGEVLPEHQAKSQEFELRQDEMPPDTETSGLEEDGSFATSMRSGEGWLCLADTGRGDEPGVPYRVIGCSAFDSKLSGAVEAFLAPRGVLAHRASD